MAAICSRMSSASSVLAVAADQSKKCWRSSWWSTLLFRADKSPASKDPVGGGDLLVSSHFHPRGARAEKRERRMPQEAAPPVCQTSPRRELGFVNWIDARATSGPR
eukprot:1088772-Pyramimonas_sp.AAC.1